jgi:outer membrane protein assembly factor BamB
MTAVHDMVYVAHHDGVLATYAAKNGQMCWAIHSGKTLESKPLVVDNRLYVGTIEGNLMAIQVTSKATR